MLGCPARPIGIHLQPVEFRSKTGPHSRPRTSTFVDTWAPTLSRQTRAAALCSENPLQPTTTDIEVCQSFVEHPVCENTIVKVSLRARAFSVRLEPRRHT